MRELTAVLAALLLLTVSAGCSPGPQPLVVHAAASLTDVLPRIGSRFSAEHGGVELVYDFGGSSSLAERIRQGSPGDVFVSASEPVMESLAGTGLVEQPVVVAGNVLQIATPPRNPAAVDTLDDFTRAELRLVACDPSVPCGAAAEQLFTTAGVEPRLDSLEGDVRAVLTKVAADEADAGLVYRTDVLAAAGRVEGVDVPGAEAASTRYPAAVVTTGERTEEARELVAYLLTPPAQQLLAGAGFRAP
ncbi:molybdate ABC transporter substrate-binding protein [Auraticoccus cholistanensis]|uniref:molybdate ABC transporter substrate-binding protein n=1 Tax=Auraticoccus cholistanensis TaxID=2656650 RepID=UPI0018D23707